MGHRRRGTRTRSKRSSRSAASIPSPTIVGSDYKSFRVKDPDGFDLAITNGTKALRRKTPANGEAACAGAIRADRLEHAVPRSHLVRSAGLPPKRGVLSGAARLGRASGRRRSGHGADRRRRRARSFAATPPRAPRVAAVAAVPVTAAAPPPPVQSANGVTAAIGHISFGIENWDTERVRAELKKRDVVYVNRDGQREPRPDMTGTLESFHVPDAMGWDLQIGNKIAPGR